MNPILNEAKCLKNLSYSELFQQELEQQDGILTKPDCIHVDTGKFKGRTPKDRFIVKHPESKDNIHWGDINQPVSQKVFNDLYEKCIQHLKTQDKIYVFEGFAGADPKQRLAVRIFTEKPWQSHFCKNMFIEASHQELLEFSPDFTIYNASSFKDEKWQKHGLNSETFILFNLEKKLGIIGGTEYGGEIKKGIFAMMNYFLPLKKILTMHCAANTDDKGNTALFFGLSGTGKTTLSTDSNRNLIGDDEHAWSDDGIFNIEGGCYAKTAGLQKVYEPDIFDAIRRNALLENITIMPDGVPNYLDTSLTENGRVSYPLDHLKHVHPQTKIAGHPKCVIFLTCDSYGVLPPVAILNEHQALFQFIAGYTAKVAGTEQGVKKPLATFSACYGAPFMPLHPLVYGKLLLEKIRQQNITCYLVNTGWVGGSYSENKNEGGQRISIDVSRTIVNACIEGSLKKENHAIDSFGLSIPTKVKNVDSAILNPMNVWKDLKQYYDKVEFLKSQYNKNMYHYKDKLASFGLDSYKADWTI